MNKMTSWQMPSRSRKQWIQIEYKVSGLPEKKKEKKRILKEALKRFRKTESLNQSHDKAICCPL